MTKQHFHHKPVYSGVLTGALLNTVASPYQASGRAIIKVLNRPHDSHFHVENPSETATYVGLYGTLVIDFNGNWVYTLNHTNSAVVALGTGATLTDSILARSNYNYRDQYGVHIVITITGA